jgi:hypothetical protein
MQKVEISVREGCVEVDKFARLTPTQGSPGSDDPGLEGGRWKGCSGGSVYAPRGREGGGPSYRPKGRKNSGKRKGEEGGGGGIRRGT